MKSAVGLLGCQSGLRTDLEDLDEEKLRECAIRAGRELRDLG
jgi:hypothetical protein